MKKIGLIGGVTWQSTLEYYKTINQEVLLRLGGAHSARLHLASLDFHEVMELANNGSADGTYPLYLEAARSLKLAGVQVMALCANSAHVHAGRLQEECGLPLVHIADATADAAKRAGCLTVGLLGTKPTMEKTFIKDRFAQQHGIRTLVPDTARRERLQRFIFEEMVVGNFSQEARRFTQQLCLELHEEGALGIVLGCTELPILMRNADIGITSFDTTTLHATAIVDAALA